MTGITIFFTTFFAQFIAEMGDKTQLMLIALASKYRLKNVLIGTAFAVAVLNALAVFIGGAVGSFLPMNIIKFIAALAFFIFALTSLHSASDDEEKKSSIHFSWEIVTVFITFVIAEAGDKTQLTALTFGASYGLSYALIIWASCSAGLFLADVVGMIIAAILKNRVNEKILSLIAFVLFTVFGFMSLNTALNFTPLFNQTARYIILFATLAVYTLVSIVFICGIFRSKSVK